MNQQSGNLASTFSSVAASREAWAGRIWLALYWAAVLVAALCTLVLVQTHSVMWDSHAPWWPRLAFGGAWLVSVALTLFSGRRLYGNARWRRPWLFTHPLAGMVGICCLAMVIVTVKATVLPWPMRELRPDYLKHEPDTEYAINSWGMRDVERQLEKDPRNFRVLFVGDSFLEGMLCPNPLSLLCEKGLAMDEGKRKVECVNLGVSGTSPIDYYYRLKNVGQPLSPDAVCLFIYSGNDYLQPGDSFRQESHLVFERWLDDRPRPSLVARLSPELGWLLQNRWKAWKAHQAPHGPANELEILKAATKLPFREGVHALAQHCHKYYYPQHPVSTLEEILGRGGPEWWFELREKPRDSEVLQGWILNNLIAWEAGPRSFPRSSDELAPEQILPHVAATRSWIEAIQRQCDEMSVSLVVFLIPKGDTDPELRQFWSHFPAWNSFGLYQDARHAELSRQLKQSNMHFVDLWQTLDGVPGTYRKTDSHWTEKGHQLVADRVAPEIRILTEPEVVTVVRQPAGPTNVLR